MVTIPKLLHLIGFAFLDLWQTPSGCATPIKPAAVRSTPVSRLSQVPWRRIVLDEAHSIKDRRCNTAKAVFALDSQYKWALSGTPLQVGHAVACSHLQPGKS